MEKELNILQDNHTSSDVEFAGLALFSPAPNGVASSKETHLDGHPIGVDDLRRGRLLKRTTP